MRIKRSLLVVVISCMGTALAMAVSGQSDDATSGVVGAVEKKHSIISQTDVDKQEPQSDIHYNLSAVKRSGPDKIRTSGLFQSKSWYTPPPPSTVSILPPPPPSAPQLPFTFIGKMIDGNDEILFLSRNGRQYTVKANDVLDDTYRVDKITDDDVVLTYLPLNIQQTLAFNSAAGGSSTLNAPLPSAVMQSPIPPQIQQQSNALSLAR